MNLELSLNKREQLALEAILATLDDTLDPDDERDEEAWANVCMIRRRVAVALAYRDQAQIFKRGRKPEDTSETI